MQYITIPITSQDSLPKKAGNYNFIFPNGKHLWLSFNPLEDDDITRIATLGAIEPIAYLMPISPIPTTQEVEDVAKAMAVKYADDMLPVEPPSFVGGKIFSLKGAYRFSFIEGYKACSEQSVSRGAFMEVLGQLNEANEYVLELLAAHQWKDGARLKQQREYNELVAFSDKMKATLSKYSPFINQTENGNTI